MDINDNPPAIERSLYNIHVQEDASVGSLLVHIKATDPDTGNYWHIEVDLIHEADPRPVVITLFTQVVRPSSLSKSAKTKQIFTAGQDCELAEGSLMTPVL